jgi:hypothetical protein
MSVVRNPNRLRELFSPASISEAADAIRRNRGVLKVLGWAFLCFLGGWFLVLYVTRLALSLPVWPQ